MSKNNIIILGDVNLVFTPAESGGGSIFIPYEDGERIEAFLNELESAYSDQSFNLLVYTRSEDLIVTDAPVLKPWEKEAFIATHREEKYGVQQVLVHSEYVRCRDSALIRDWVVELSDAALSVYEMLLSRNILILGVYSVGFSLASRLINQSKERRLDLKSIRSLFLRKGVRNIYVVYDCEFVYFYVTGQCGTLFFRHTYLDKEASEDIVQLIIREVDLTMRFIMTKNIITDDEPVSFTIFAPEYLLEDARLQDKHAFVSLSMLAGLSGFRCRPVKELYGRGSKACDAAARVSMLSALLIHFRLPPLIRMTAGRINEIIQPLGFLLWIILFMSGVTFSYYIGMSASRFMALKDGIATVQYQQSKLAHIRNIILSKLQLKYDPSDMYQLVMFNDALRKTRPTVRWSSSYLPALSVLHTLTPDAWIRQFTFEDVAQNILQRPDFTVTVLVGLPFRAYSLLRIYRLMERVSRQLNRQQGVQRVRIVKSPFNSDVTKLLKVDVDNYKKDYYFFIISYSYSPAN
ncbi:hypothetical protein D6779_01305 [Candidatus Parcubacteria bacterium]|nr:MAG: hypothetical protein D6779_01305 [Candidatus Parcubacteria bacterium]